jgi:6-phosphogluconolactonase (cycloisomerase 2 family)
VASDDGRFAYTTNTANGTISSYEITRDGTLSLLNPTAAVTGKGTAPTDMALSSDSRFIYVREGGSNSVGGLQVEANGSLTPVGSVDGVPASAQGIAAF